MFWHAADAARSTRERPPVVLAALVSHWRRQDGASISSAATAGPRRDARRGAPSREKSTDWRSGGRRLNPILRSGCGPLAIPLFDSVARIRKVMQFTIRARISTRRYPSRAFVGTPPDDQIKLRCHSGHMNGRLAQGVLVRKEGEITMRPLDGSTLANLQTSPTCRSRNGRWRQSSDSRPSSTTAQAIPFSGCAEVDVLVTNGGYAASTRQSFGRPLVTDGRTKTRPPSMTASLSARAILPPTNHAEHCSNHPARARTSRLSACALAMAAEYTEIDTRSESLGSSASRRHESTNCRATRAHGRTPVRRRPLRISGSTLKREIISLVRAKIQTLAGGHS